MSPQAKNFAQKQVALAEQTAKREAAERETKATRTRVLYLLAAVATLVVLLVASTAMNVIMTTRGTTKVVEKYHYTETRGNALTNEQGETLQCASADMEVVSVNMTKRRLPSIRRRLQRTQLSGRQSSRGAMDGKGSRGAIDASKSGGPIGNEKTDKVKNVLTNRQGEVVSTSSADFETSTTGMLLTTDGEAIATKSADFETNALGHLLTPSGKPIVTMPGHVQIGRRSWKKPAYATSNASNSSGRTHRRLVEQHLYELRSGKVSRAAASHHHRTLSNLFHACNDGEYQYHVLGVVETTEVEEGGAVFMDNPEAKKWDTAMQLRQGGDSLHLCLGFTSESWMAMYERAIDEGAYDDLCCDVSAGFFKGPGGHCYSFSRVSGREDATWTDARESCAFMGAHLAIFLDAGELDAVTHQVVSDVVSEVWIG